MISQRHELMRLAQIIDWSMFEDRFELFFATAGRRSRKPENLAYLPADALLARNLIQ